jgi:hypothetical protein
VIDGVGRDNYITLLELDRVQYFEQRGCNGCKGEAFPRRNAQVVTRPCLGAGYELGDKRSMVYHGGADILAVSMITKIRKVLPELQYGGTWVSKATMIQIRASSRRRIWLLFFF